MAESVEWTGEEGAGALTTPRGQVLKLDDLGMVRQLTQAEYDAIATPDPGVLYVIVEP